MEMTFSVLFWQPCHPFGAIHKTKISSTVLAYLKKPRHKLDPTSVAMFLDHLTL